MSRSGTTGSFRLALASSLLALALASGPGCGDRKFGAPCSLTVTVSDPAPTTYYVDANAVACPAHICLLPAQQRTTDTGALCSQTCQTDADCEEGQSRDPSDATDRRCASGFACRPIPLVPDLTGAQSCQKMCTCRDFLADGTPPPAGCP